MSSVQTIQTLTIEQLAELSKKKSAAEIVEQFGPVALLMYPATSEIIPMQTALPSNDDPVRRLFSMLRSYKGLWVIFVGHASMCTFGRDDHAGIALPEPSVSREHARITVNQKKYFLEDLGSRNGTWVNSQPVTSEKAPLHDGDTIFLGDCQMIFLFTTTLHQQVQSLPKK